MFLSRKSVDGNNNKLLIQSSTSSPHPQQQHHHHHLHQNFRSDVRSKNVMLNASKSNILSSASQAQIKSNGSTGLFLIQQSDLMGDPSSSKMSIIAQSRPTRQSSSKRPSDNLVARREIRSSEIRIQNRQSVEMAGLNSNGNSDDSTESIESAADLCLDSNLIESSCSAIVMTSYNQLASSGINQFAINDTTEFSLQKLDNDDLVTLNNLNETIVLEQLKIRFSQNKIYTYIGDILIALNPLKALAIYGKRISSYYQSCENIRANLPPHVYATAEQCFREMIRTQQSQCILISGESGSGKTETCKYLVQHLLNRTKPFEICLNTKIEEVNHILEAFGNAKTRINDNSSRFGKYLEIYFEQDGTVIGAKFKEYLLEKSRVVYQNEYESTFHIFHLLFAGLTGEEKLRYNLLRPPKQYRFLSNASLESCVSNENEERFLAIKKSLLTIGFTQYDITNLLKILVCILLIGEIRFVQKKGNNNDAVQVANMEIIQNVCELLEIDVNDLNDALVSDVQITRGEEIKRERNMVQACDIRDALAKAFYGRLFSWIVNQINHHIQPLERVNSSYSIGLLDIFGFENFEKNSFEQMCINLANEQLHQLFTKYIFKLEIQECLDEQIELNDSDFITYQDNQIILDLFLEKRTGIFALLDEESRFPKATDQSLAIKLHQTLAPLYPEVYVAPKNVGTSFHIVHYAGQVLYNNEGFLEKNRDFLPNNLFNAARDSKNLLVQELFQCKLTRKGTIAPSDRQSRVRKTSNNENSENNNVISNSSIRSMNNGGTNGGVKHFYNHQDINTSSSAALNEISNTPYNNKLNNMSKSRLGKSPVVIGYNNSINSQINFKNEEMRSSINSVNNQYSSDKVLPLTVACHFKNSLHELIEKINKCKAYFIRCIKPNPNQNSVIINEFVIKQLRYCSLMHVCKIRKCGFPYRIRFEEFLKWYKAIDVCIGRKQDYEPNLDSKATNESQVLKNCLKCLDYANITNYKVGKTKLFLRYWHIDILNSIAKTLEKKVFLAQKIIRGWLIRNRLKRIHEQQLGSFCSVVELKSNEFYAKLNSQRAYKLPVAQYEPSRRQIAATSMILEQEYLQKSGMRSEMDCQMVVAKFSKNKTGSSSNSNWPDLNEINITLEEFDSMLEEYDTDVQMQDVRVEKAQFSNRNHLMNNMLVTRSTSSIQNGKPPSVPISANNQNDNNPNSIIHLVHNKNNKNDNTLKKRNALVAFEFKTLLDRVASPDRAQQPNHHHHHHSHQSPTAVDTFLFTENMLQQSHSPPPSYPSTSTSPCSTTSSSTASSPSTSSSKKIENARGVSPSQLVPNLCKVVPGYENVPNRVSYVRSTPPNQPTYPPNLKSKSQVITMNGAGKVMNCVNSPDVGKVPTQQQQQQAKYRNGDMKNNVEIVSSKTNGHTTTIWREELNAKSNVQEQIKKQTELTQKLEDSKKNMPEWKRNLLKQKEMKKISNMSHQNISNVASNQETPELMKHNIFIKKGLATHGQ